MASYVKFYAFVNDIASKVHNLGSDQLKVALTNSAPTQSNTVIANITEITYTYCSTRNLTTSSSSQTSGTYKLILNDLTLTASGGSVGPYRYVVIYNVTAASGNLICYFDLGSSYTLNDTDQQVLDLDNTNGLLQIA